MSVRVGYDPECDQNFKDAYEEEFQEWIHKNPIPAVESRQIIFDQAYVL